ncbi:MAG: hypothetical protein HY093_04275 [Candidatus Liptonbacteria bacterium]|nr:hypothetical protein [Candidatus Liptonbacteria bacterium]
MKLISLNIWGGKKFGPLLEFIKSQASSTDIFCFQEVFRSSAGPEVSNGMKMNIFSDLVAALPDHDGYFAPIQEQYDLHEKINFPAASGETIFAKRSLPILSHGERFIYGSYNDVVVRDGLLDLPVAIQYINIEGKSNRLTIAHLHGIVWPGKKEDSPARLEQSQNIINFLSEQPGEKILCGDFNLLPNTESIQMIEKNGMKNLIKDFKISTTRSIIEAAKYGGNLQHFADYCFVSPSLKIKNFTVPTLAISDHLPLILEFS